MDTEKITLSERLVTGFMSALVMAFMAVCVPIAAMLLITKGRGLDILRIFGSFHIWGITLIVVAGIVGAALGVDRATTLFGHLWGTEEPKRDGVTLSLWIVLIGIGLASYWMFGRHHAL
jgi:hypothetical protein